MVVRGVPVIEQVVQNEGVALEAEFHAHRGTPTGGHFLVKKPDGTTTTWSATLEAPSRPGDPYVLVRLTEDGDFDQPGEYVIQPVITGPDMSIRGRPVVIEVHEELEVWHE